MTNDIANTEGAGVDDMGAARASEAARLHEAEVKLERAQAERQDADRSEDEAREEIREIEEEIEGYQREIHFEVDGESFDIPR